MRGMRGQARYALRVGLALALVAPAQAALAQSAESRQASELDLWPAAPIRADSLRVIHLLQRATYGARPEDIALASRLGPAAWVDWQLHPSSIDDRELELRLKRHPTVSMNPGELFSAYPPPQRVQRMAPGAAMLSPMERRERGLHPPSEIAADMASVKLQRAVYSRRQLLEVMTDFWFNHFNVDFGKGQAKWLVADYERNAIRPHVLGRFDELLAATATHPAMLVYLDNRMNLAPDPLASTENPRRYGRDAREESRGINENYARELLELHTLGVDGGYTQSDVVEVARAFTGWTVAGLGEREALDESLRGVAFAYRDALHDEAAKSILGQEFPGGGIEEGYAVLRLLAHHPSTAERVAIKLVRAFVSDEPQPELVDEITAVFLATDGDLTAVTRALFTSPWFYQPRAMHAKLKSPFELMASAVRLTEAEIAPSEELVETLHALGHSPYMESAPTGYPETNGEWLNAGALVQRINFGLSLAQGTIAGVRVDPASLVMGKVRDELGGARREAPFGDDDLATLTDRLVPGGRTARLKAVVRDELGAMEARGVDARARRALALILGSLDFQRH